MPKTGDIYQQATCKSICRIWNNIKSLYWASELTFESDILVAFSGITASMEKTVGMTNLYGMWAEFLELELLWSVKSPRYTVRSSAYPTWSWASMHGTDFEKFYHAKEWFTKERRVQISIEKFAALGLPPNSQNCEPPRALRVHGPLLSTSLRQTSPRIYSPAKQPLALILVWLDHMIPENREVYLLQVVRYDKVCDEQERCSPPDRCSGLVLLPVEAETLTFQRVGVWENFWGFTIEDTPKSIKDKEIRFTTSETIFLV